MSEDHTLDKKGNALYWWAALTAIPSDNESLEYCRLKRVWFDHTRFRGAKGTAERYHEFVKPTEETNLTVTLWENFSIFEASVWVPAIFAVSGLAKPKGKIDRCSWSYEWYFNTPSRQDDRMCDVVFSFRSDGIPTVVVVEAKGLDKMMRPKDLTSEYYLDIPDIAAFGDHRYLIYLIDQTRKDKLVAAVRSWQPRIGILTWQQLGGVQIQLAKALDVPKKIATFVAGAIQYQFAQHNIRPSSLSADYLDEEPSALEIDNPQSSSRQSMQDHCVPLWRLSEWQQTSTPRGASTSV
jgi:hypothetical protein